jgi:hypothetical protein
MTAWGITFQAGRESISFLTTVRRSGVVATLTQAILSTLVHAEEQVVLQRYTINNEIVDFYDKDMQRQFFLGILSNLQSASTGWTSDGYELTGT